MQPTAPPPTDTAPPPAARTLSRGRRIALGFAYAPMVLVGLGGAYGTFVNMSQALESQGTALGLVAAGEGAVLVLAVVALVIVTMGQAVPRGLRLSLWILPAVASAVGATLGNDTNERVAMAITPLAMTAAAEGGSFLARRVVVYTTGHDVEAEHASADVLRRLAHQDARATGHPVPWVKYLAKLRVWRLAAKVGTGDPALAADLLAVQRAKVTAGAGRALDRVYGTAPATPADVPAAAVVDIERDDAEDSLDVRAAQAEALTAAAPRPALPSAAEAPSGRLRVVAKLRAEVDPEMPEEECVDAPEMPEEVSADDDFHTEEDATEVDTEAAERLERPEMPDTEVPNMPEVPDSEVPEPSTAEVPAPPSPPASAAQRRARTAEATARRTAVRADLGNRLAAGEDVSPAAYASQHQDPAVTARWVSGQLAWVRRQSD